MKPAPFAYCRAETLEEALALLAELGADASVLAGGQSLAPMLNMRLARPAAVVDINRIAGLDAVTADAEFVRTGALLRQSTALEDAALAARVPLLALALPHVGHFQTRGRGTLGGSVAHADPSAEIPLCLATLGGAVVLRSTHGERRIAARDFFRGALATAREADELVVALDWPARRPGAGYAFEEIAQRRGDYAIAAAAASVERAADGNLAALALGLGGVEERPFVVDGAAWAGAPASEATAAEVARHAAEAVDPIEDLQADAAFRRRLVRVLGARALARAMQAAAPEG